VRRMLLIMVAAVTLAAQLARARLATARYALNLHAAKHDGYQRITRMIPDMGWHYLWHPDLVTLHVWVWYHNPAGLYSGTNPLVRPFNHG
jgi:hypothetical protein